MPALGILFALIALFAWGFGDFFIQKTARAVGDLKALVYITLTTTVVLLPFVWQDLGRVLAHANAWWLLGIVGIVSFFAALFDFEALKQGKIAVVEPLLGIEVPVVVFFSVIFRHEFLPWYQLLLILLIIIGIILTVTKHVGQWKYHRRLLEKGVLWAGLGAIGMGLTNFLVGVLSQDTLPLITVWFAHTVIAVCSLLLIAWRGEWRGMFKSIKKHPGIIIGETVFDNMAWVSYAFATTLIPISIATAISESYIALAVLLGVFVNKEKLKKHQLVGIGCALFGVILLSRFVG